MIHTFDDIKRLPLQDIMEQYGYIKDERKSTRLYPVMKKQGEKLVLHLNAQTGHWNYFMDGQGGGTAIDFLQKQGLSFGQIRETYCENVSVNDTLSLNRQADTDHRESKTIISFTQKYHRYFSDKKFKYSDVPLFKDIGISKETFNELSHNFNKSPFSLVFPFYSYRDDALKINGIYHHRIAGEGLPKFFEKQSTRGLGLVGRGTATAASYLFITEQPLDAMAHYELQRQAGKKMDKVTYVMTGGGVGSVFEEHFKRFVQGHKPKHIYLGLDNDSKGHEFAERLKVLIDEQGMKSSRLLPKHKDWQDDLILQTINQQCMKIEISQERYISHMHPERDKEKIKTLLETDDENRDLLLTKLIDEHQLRDVLKKEQSPELSSLIKERLTMLEQIKLAGGTWILTFDEINQCDNLEVLRQVALTDKKAEARMIATHQIAGANREGIYDALLAEMAIANGNSGCQLVARVCVRNIMKDKYLNIVSHKLKGAGTDLKPLINQIINKRATERGEGVKNNIGR